MMVQNVIQLEEEFSIRSRIDVKDVSQILTYTPETTHQWNRLLLEKLTRNQAQDITIHICPWHEDDLEQYLELGKQISRIVIWSSDQMPSIESANQDIQVVHYKPIDYSERFVVVTATGVARALVSWNQRDHSGEASFVGVFISNPTIANGIATTLNQKLEGANLV